MPERKIDGKNIWSLMSGEDGAKSPHENYVLMHGPGTVRSGKWKFYPWPEGKGGKRDKTAGKNPTRFPVQLYDTVAVIGERKNIADKFPEVIEQLQTAYKAHLKDLAENKRPTANMPRPAKKPTADRPGGAKKKPKKKKA